MTAKSVAPVSVIVTPPRGSHQGIVSDLRRDRPMIARAGPLEAPEVTVRSARATGTNQGRGSRRPAGSAGTGATRDAEAGKRRLLSLSCLFTGGGHWLAFTLGNLTVKTTAG